jgi:hypothetical protein
MDTLKPIVVTKPIEKIDFCECTSSGCTGMKHIQHVFNKHSNILISAIENAILKNPSVAISDFFKNKKGFVNLTLQTNTKQSFIINCDVCFYCFKIFYDESVSIKQKSRSYSESKEGSTSRTYTINDKINLHIETSKKCSDKLREEAFLLFLANAKKGSEVISEFLTTHEIEKKPVEKKKAGRPKKDKKISVDPIDTVSKMEDYDGEKRDIDFYRTYSYFLLSQVKAYEKQIESLITAPNKIDRRGRPIYKYINEHNDDDILYQYKDIINESKTTFDITFSSEMNKYAGDSDSKDNKFINPALFKKEIFEEEEKELFDMFYVNDETITHE